VLNTLTSYSNERIQEEKHNRVNILNKKTNFRKSLYVSSSNKLNVDIPGLGPEIDDNLLLNENHLDLDEHGNVQVLSPMNKKSG
jgi:hypothetical protein